MTQPSMSAAPLLYSASFESPEDDEAETARSLTETLRGIAETTLKDYGYAVRSVHAKSHGLLSGQLRVMQGLPGPLAQGLFARAAAYPVVIRLSTTPGDILDDSISTPRGMAIKVLGVEGERLPGSENDITQDFVLVNGPAFQSPSGKSFLKSLKLLAATTDTPQAPKKAISAVLRASEAFVEAFGGKSPTLTSLGGQPKTHILGDTFYSQVPILFGPYMGKIAVAPISPELMALAGTPLDLSGKPNGLREAVVDFFARQGGEWELRVQLCTDLEAMPIEKPNVIWPEDQSPYVAVARITIAPQEAWNEERSNTVDGGFSFSPWHGIVAHRPLGRIMRMRKQTYEAIARFRRERNGRTLQEPCSFDELPGFSRSGAMQAQGTPSLAPDSDQSSDQRRRPEDRHDAPDQPARQFERR